MAIPDATSRPLREGLRPVTSPCYAGTRKTHLVWCELPGVVGASKGLASLGPRKEISGKDLN